MNPARGGAAGHSNTVGGPSRRGDGSGDAAESGRDGGGAGNTGENGSSGTGTNLNEAGSVDDGSAGRGGAAGNGGAANNGGALNGSGGASGSAGASGSGGASGDLSAEGDPCEADAECASSRCVDGVCCESACNGVCARCDAAGSEGRCVAAASDEACGELSCPHSTDCREYVAGNLEDNCMGIGACLRSPPCTINDAPEGTACGTGDFAGSCDGAGECVVEGRAELGEVCGSGAECGSTHCFFGNEATGICCDDACDGVCEACGSDGHCDAVPEDDERCEIVCPESSACVTYPADPTENRCGGFGQCVAEAVACAAQYAEAGEGCGSDRVCDGFGACVLSCPTSTGAARTCSAECPCGTGEGVCASNVECDTGLLCSAGAGRKFGFQGNTCIPTHCDNDVEDADETSQDCGGECGCTATLEWFELGGTMKALSDDGSTIVGYTSVSTGHAVYWDAQLVRHDLQGGRAYAVNATGSVIVGEDSGPVRWQNLQVAPTLLSVSEFSSGAAYAVSADGTVIAGQGNDGSQLTGFTWAATAVEWDYAFYSLRFISADGTRALGFLMGEGNTPAEPALREPSGMRVIQLFDDWEVSSLAALSRDGTSAIGVAYSAGQARTAGFLWQFDADVIMFDGHNDYSPLPSCISDDGLVVGQSGYGGMPATYWAEDNAYEPRQLTELMADHGLEPDPAWVLSAPVGMTPDGRVMVGTGTNGGYRFRLEP